MSLINDTFKSLKQEVVVVGKTRVRSWHAWLSIGLAVGVTAGILSVANRSGEFETGYAQSSISSEGLVAWWKFDEGSGTSVVDSSGNGNTGTLGGNASFTAGRFGGGVLVPSDVAYSNTYVNVGTNNMPANNAPQTISLWFKGDMNLGRYDFISLYNSRAKSALGLSAHAALYASKWGTGIFSTNTYPSANVWHHLAYTYDGETHSLYYDGSLISSSVAPANTAIPNAVHIGRSASNCCSWSNVAIDDVRIYKRRLSLAEISGLFSGSAPVLETTQMATIATSTTPTPTPTPTPIPTLTPIPTPIPPIPTPVPTSAPTATTIIPTPTATPAISSFLPILLEAENFALLLPMSQGSDSLALGNRYISPISGANSFSPVREASLTVNIPTAGMYYLWARIMGPTSASDALYAGINSSWDRIFPSIPNTYEWVRVESADASGFFGFNLAEGSQTIQIGHGELNSRLDAVYLTNNSADIPAFIPTSTPTPTPTPGIVSTPPPVPTPAAFNFLLSNGGNKTVIQGQSTSNSVTATLVSGTSQVAGFAVSGLPAGATGIFSPGSCSPTCATTLTISTLSTTPVGNYPVNLTAVAGSVIKTSIFTLTVNAPANPPLQPPSPPPSTKFINGDTVQIISGPLNVRATANGVILGTQSVGAFGIVVGGPVNLAGFNWWNVDYDNAPDGWSAENFFAKAVASAPVPTPAPTSVPPSVGGATAEPLITAANLTYLGGFRLPRGQFGGSNFTNGGLVMAHNPARNSLFIVGHGDFGGEQFVSEISIPALVNSSVVTSLNTATMLQNFADITDGRIKATLSTSCPAANIVGGLLVNGDKIHANVYCAYDSDRSQKIFHGVSGTTLSTLGDFKGYFPMFAPPQAGFAGYLSGWMAHIPAEWQALLGGNALTGNCCLSITARTSVGPSAYSFNLSDAGVKNPIPATPLTYYTLTNPLRNNLSTNNVYNATTRIRGMIFPPGFRSVLYFGTQGTGSVCYGDTVLCPDPVDQNKGYHAYPYQSQIWAYDANDFLAVKNGTKLPWAVQPYAVIPLNFPIKTGGSLQVSGAAYDPATQRIYVAQFGAESIGGGNGQSIIQVFKIQ